MTKFISKNANLRVVLSPGIPGERLRGRLATPGKYVKFEMGVANVEDPKWIELMKSHSGFNSDFIVVDDKKADPFAGSRREIEPEHDNISIDYGHIGKNLNPKSPVLLNKEQKQLVSKMASEMAKTMVKDILKEISEKKVKEKIDIPDNTDSSEAKFLCSKGCGKSSSSKFGIMAHERHCKNEKKDSSVIVEEAKK